MNNLTRIENGIRYLESGPEEDADAPVYLLIHGLGGSLEQWTQIVCQLSSEARTIAIDVPGFGRSRTIVGDFNLEQSAISIAEFCRAKELSKCILVSHSVGCVIASRVAAIEPEMFARLIFVSGALIRASEMAQRPVQAFSHPRLGLTVALQFLAGIFPIPPAALRFMANSPRLRSAALWPFVAYPTELSPQLVVKTLTGTGSLAVLRILFGAKSIDYAGIISAVDKPVDIICGDEDRLINDEDKLLLRQMVHLEGDHVIRRCGHWPWLEKPAELAELLSTRSGRGRPSQ